MQDVAAPHLLKGLLQEYLLPILKTRFETGGRIMSRFCEAEYFLRLGPVGLTLYLVTPPQVTESLVLRQMPELGLSLLLKML